MLAQKSRKMQYFRVNLAFQSFTKILYEVKHLIIKAVNKVTIHKKGENYPNRIISQDFLKNKAEGQKVPKRQKVGPKSCPPLTDTQNRVDESLTKILGQKAKSTNSTAL